MTADRATDDRGRFDRPSRSCSAIPQTPDLTYISRNDLSWTAAAALSPYEQLPIGASREVTYSGRATARSTNSAAVRAGTGASSCRLLIARLELGYQALRDLLAVLDTWTVRVDYRHREGGTMLTTDPKLRVLQALQAREGMTAMQVAGRTMLPPSAVVRVLRTLLEAAVVTFERDRRGRQRYFLANRDRTTRSRGRHLSGVAH